MNSETNPSMKKIYAIMHLPPPVHGASKVGEFIKNNVFINNELDILYSPIKVSNNIQEIGKFSLKKILTTLIHFSKILFDLFTFKPDAIYFTISPSGFAFYRDILFILPIKIYTKMFNKKYFLHSHARGIGKFLAKSSVNKLLGNFLLSNANLILLDKSLSYEFLDYNNGAKTSYLPNCTQDPFNTESFEFFIESKFTDKKDEINFLYMANMIKSKGYEEILNFAAKNYNNNYKFNFAGGWESEQDKNEFYRFIDLNNLEKSVYHHGLVAGEEKDYLFRSADIFLFPTNYPKETVPLCIIEAFSYGLPVITRDTGAIKNMVNSATGVIMQSDKNLDHYLEEINALRGLSSSKKARDHYIKNFTTKKFQENFVNILK